MCSQGLVLINLGNQSSWNISRAHWLPNFLCNRDSSAMHTGTKLMQRLEYLFFFMYSQICTDSKVNYNPQKIDNIRCEINSLLLHSMSDFTTGNSNNSLCKYSSPNINLVCGWVILQTLYILLGDWWMNLRRMKRLLQQLMGVFKGSVANRIFWVLHQQAWVVDWGYVHNTSWLVA